MLRLVLAALLLSAAFLTVIAVRALVVTAERHAQVINTRITEDDRP